MSAEPMKPALLIALCLIIVGCSSEKRFQRFLADNPEFARNDTIRDTVLVTIPGEHFDTALVIYVHDTIRIDTGRLHVRIIRLPGDTFLVDGQCDTVYKDVPFEVVVEKLVPCPPGLKVKAWWKTAALICGGLLLLLLGLLVFKNRRE